MSAHEPAHEPGDLQRIYDARFSANLDYRKKVWSILVSDWFNRYIRRTDSVLDLGCGYGEFINAIACSKKYAMDLNPDAVQFLAKDVTFLQQDCSTRWPLADASLDVIFTSNFLEHLPDKAAVGRTLDQVHRCLRPGGRFIAMGPNIKYLPGAYWDFWDHYVPLSDAAVREALVTRGFSIDQCFGKFLPYTMATPKRYPVTCLRAYLKLSVVWRLFGRQFLVVGRRP